MVKRFSRQYGAGLWAAQEARRDMRRGDFEYSISDGQHAFSARAIIDTSTPDAPAATPDAATTTPLVAVASGTSTPGAPRGQRGGRDAGRETGTAHSPGTLPLERDVQAAVLALLVRHPRVAWAHRFNTGGMYNASGQYVAFAFPGCSDILGMLKGGRFLAFECKRPGRNPTPEQWEFLCLVNRHGGIGRVITSVDDALEALR